MIRQENIRLSYDLMFGLVAFIRLVAFGCSTLYLLGSSCLSSCPLTSPVMSNRLWLLSDRDRFARVEEASPRRFRFCPEEEDDRGYWLILSLFNKLPVLD
jgi:hypothetical protein